MIDYDKIITELGEEISECDYRYCGMVPAYYQRELERAVTALIKCRESLKGLQNYQSEDSASHDPYKTAQLLKMLAHETSSEEHYGARLHHGGGNTKVLTIDAGGLRALITHYATHRTELENEDELEGKL